jgi:hypothetical protein
MKEVKNSTRLPIPQPTSRWHWRLKLAPTDVTLVQRSSRFWLEPTIVASRATQARPYQRATTEIFVGVVSVGSWCLCILALLG